MTDRDCQLDDDLRRVPLPEKLQAGLTPEGLFADAALDRLVAAVAVPQGLAERVRTAARSGDARGRTGVVDLTRFAGERGARLPMSQPLSGETARRRSRSLLGLARETGRVAAAIGLAMLLALAGIELSRRLEGPAIRGRGVVASAPAGGRAVPGIARGPQPAGDAIVGRSDGGRAVEPIDGLAAGGSAPGFAAGDEAAADDRASAPEANAAAGPHSDPQLAARPSPGRVRGAAIPLVDGSGPPPMTLVSPPRDTRRQVPKSPAFDLAFEMAHGESPFVAPAADPALAIDRPPLTLRTDGFDLLVQPVADRRPRGLAERVRVEEVLAAMPAPERLATPAGGPVRLGLFAVRSGRVVGGQPTVLLEAVAFAAGEPSRRTEPLRLTLILDQAAAGDPRAWPRVCRGVAAVAGRLAPADRVSVVLCGPRPRVAIRDADPATLAAAAVNWEALPASASSDLDAAVAAARTAGLLDCRTVIVAHTVTLERGRSDVRDLLAAWHRGLALTGGDPLAGSLAGGPGFIVLDPAAPAPARDAGPAFGRTSIDAVAIRRELLRQVTGDDTLVARQCRLEVRFDPARVAGYRLVGHRQSVVESLAEDQPPAVDLHAGETVRAVYEVVPKDAAGIGLATASLDWRAADGTTARLEAVDGDAGDRGAVLPSPHGCELVLAATLGELAAGSVHVVQPRVTLAALAAVADRWRARGDLTPFGSALVLQLDRRTAGPRPAR